MYIRLFQKNMQFSKRTRQYLRKESKSMALINTSK